MDRLVCGDAVTFVGHDASRTGAPLLLLSLLRWAQTNRRESVELLLCAGGPLLEDYNTIAATTVLTSPLIRASAWSAHALRSVGSTMAVPLGRIDEAVLRRFARLDADRPLIVANTVAALPAAAAIADSTTTLVCHVHELDHVLERSLPPGHSRRDLLGRVDRFIATGWPVQSMLTDRFGIAEERVETVGAFTTPANMSAGDVEVAQGRLHATSQRPIVATIGPLSVRKGPDRFLDLIQALRSRHPEVVGVWIGSDADQPMWREVRDDIERLGLDRSILLRPSMADPAATVAAADVVVSTAREDPFPLGLLEAAVAGVPVVTFDSGGFSQMMSGLGLAEWVVPIGDTLLMRDVVGRLLEHPSEARAAASLLQQHVLAEHVVDRLAPQLWDAMTRSIP